MNMQSTTGLFAFFSKCVRAHVLKADPSSIHQGEVLMRKIGGRKESDGKTGSHFSNGEI